MAVRGPTGIPEPRRLVFIGLGGIGSWIVEPVMRYFHATNPQVHLVDGDYVERKNLARQSFEAAAIREFKARSLRDRLSKVFTGSSITAHTSFVEATNVENYVREGDAIFLCPDNHEVRRIVATEAAKRHEVTVFTAGNELYDGNCHVFVKKANVALTNDFIQRHPEARDSAERSEGCTELINMGDVQLIAVNFMVAALVITAVHQTYCYGAFRDKEDAWCRLPQELYGSVIHGRVRTSPAPDRVKEPEPESKPKAEEEKKLEVMACS